MGYVPFGLHLNEESLLKAVYVMKTSCCHCDCIQYAVHKETKIDQSQNERRLSQKSIWPYILLVRL